MSWIALAQTTDKESPLRLGTRKRQGGAIARGGGGPIAELAEQPALYGRQQIVGSQRRIVLELGDDVQRRTNAGDARQRDRTIERDHRRWIQREEIVVE